MKFRLVSKFKPTGDQPKAIEKLVAGIGSKVRHQVLLGVTGSGKTFTMAGVIERTQKPTLVISPNKTLAAQLYQEFREFFPQNAVHYFVSYYDYYQPEAYIPQTDTYIEKDAKINETIDRMRHEAVQDALSRKDTIVVASVSCLYNIGSPEDYQDIALDLTKGQKIQRRNLLAHLASLQYQRNDMDFAPGTFRVRGDSIEIFSVTGTELVRIEMTGDRVEELAVSQNIIQPSWNTADSYRFFPAKFWVTPQDKLAIAMENVRAELQESLQELRKVEKLLEAQRLEQRTNYDLELIEESGYCHGIENYSRHLEFRAPGSPPFTLLDYFQGDFLVFVDESHLTLPQMRAMAVQDRARKLALIEYGFRLPSAVDNRPLTFEEAFERIPQAVYVSATPGDYEMQKSKPHIAEQLIRPTGLLEPSIEIRPTVHQIQDVIKEIEKHKAKKQRVLVLTLTKRLAEDIAEYLAQRGISAQWLHSEVKTLERPKLLEDFRRGTYDAIVGINLLREGLDLPEVALVAILDADKEGFLRNETTLIQTMGRAARHPEGKAILYADTLTFSLKNAIKEIERRKRIQETYNKKYRIIPQPVRKDIRPWGFADAKATTVAEFGPIKDIELLQREMRDAARNLDFERAAQIRDLIKKLGAPSEA
ncbi:MAG TPA: excinuclease ABC subunit B [Candidatus Wildermuthbacteria bacterium]|uniref:UvrABC system protein B n=1 Tax=Candidatus Yanofskybacteria bacterium GW2011_GWC1_48_11 TaxID=1619027 RepID=A0A837IR35_9BACT|nr:MAG: UvrABC system protein B [Candidatus Yanofskybacteria bacterium GW2011_GWC1_48_11]KKW03956.1 MAG: UvrABC system protein B [Parcubacteria group bacterium GW2011_GWB1_49_12]KKW08698.1 MAG: UvrABC system protein B [Parcubacteria group bacterium GW2011_GWA1_49_26]KKW13958.1 MAG: UvrABC system protein B [Parcubacteria group bacterium GW2011_GWA2_50_10]OHA61648.1 MAG: excinuclease ABC subunit B [Candidatus Wildermuthbacteria bacterium GWA1_49_26]OHA65366.1 MAG: excinuclease ABC subunit B [Can